MVLPTGGKKRYILQTKISNIFIDPFQVTILDPRSSTRFSLSTPATVKIRPVRDATSIRFQSGEIRVIRYVDEALLDEPAGAVATPANDTSGEGKKKPAAGEASPFSIRDMVFNKEGDEPAEDYIILEKQSPIAGSIVDISCGGMCAAYNPNAGETFFIDQLVAVECGFAKDSAKGGGQIGIFVFAVVRGMKNNEGGNQLHLRFLAGLPNKIQSCWPQQPQESS